MTTLAIATSADTCSVALLADEEVVAIRTFAHEMRLLERLVPIMDAVLSDASVTLAEVDLLATDLGPGSFTGIRIGITTIKTIAWAQGKQAVGIPSLECIAAEARREHVVALIRARPGLAYRQVFGSGPTPMGDAAMVTIESALSGLDPLPGDEVWHIAAAEGLNCEAIAALAAEAAFGVSVLPPVAFDAATVGRLARRRAFGQDMPGPLTLAPLYVAEPIIGPPATKS